MWEVFVWSDGAPIWRLHWRWLARLISRVHGLDYARDGEGWLEIPGHREIYAEEEDGPDGWCHPTRQPDCAECRCFWQPELIRSGSIR